MTNKEAIEILNTLRINRRTYKYNLTDIRNALDRAIKALENVELTVDAQITFDEYVRRCNITQSGDCPYDE